MNVVTAGEIFRFLGLLMELLGILGVSILSTRGAAALPTFLGSDPDRVLKTMVVCGFVLWLIGRILIYGFHRRRGAFDEPADSGGRGQHDLRL